MGIERLILRWWWTLTTRRPYRYHSTTSSYVDLLPRRRFPLADGVFLRFQAPRFLSLESIPIRLLRWRLSDASYRRPHRDAGFPLHDAGQRWHSAPLSNFEGWRHRRSSDRDPKVPSEEAGLGKGLETRGGVARGCRGVDCEYCRRSTTSLRLLDRPYRAVSVRHQFFHLNAKRRRPNASLCAIEPSRRRCLRPKHHETSSELRRRRPHPWHFSAPACTCRYWRPSP